MPAELTHDTEHIHNILCLHLLEQDVHGYVGAGPPHPRTAVDHHGGALLRHVVLVDTVTEGQQASGILGHPMVRPGRKVELGHVQGLPVTRPLHNQLPHGVLSQTLLTLEGHGEHAKDLRAILWVVPVALDLHTPHGGRERCLLDH